MNEWLFLVLPCCVLFLLFSQLPHRICLTVAAASANNDHDDFPPKTEAPALKVLLSEIVGYFFFRTQNVVGQGERS